MADKLDLDLDFLDNKDDRKESKKEEPSLNTKSSPEDSATKLEARRNKSIGIVLIANSAISLIFLIMASSSGTDSSGARSILPAIIDAYLGVQLLRKKYNVLNWVYWRAILGGILWSILALADQSWYQLIGQAIFAAYFAYLIRGELSNRKIKIANFVLIPLVILFTYFSSTIPTGQDAAFINDTKALFTDFSVYNKQQQDLMATDAKNLSNSGITQLFQNIISISEQKQAKINALKTKIDEGLNTYKSDSDQKVLLIEKELVDAHNRQNNKIIELAKYGLSINFAYATQAQITEFKNINDEIIAIEKEIEDIGKKLQDT